MQQSEFRGFVPSFSQDGTRCYRGVGKIIEVGPFQANQNKKKEGTGALYTRLKAEVVNHYGETVVVNVKSYAKAQDELPQVGANAALVYDKVDENLYFTASSGAGTTDATSFGHYLAESKYADRIKAAEAARKLATS